MEGIHSFDRSGPLVACDTLCSLTKRINKNKNIYTTHNVRAFGDDGTSNVIAKT
jgi:hypothetical protein